MYLPNRHNKVAKSIYKTLVCTETNKRTPTQEVYSNDHEEISWDMKINTIPKLDTIDPILYYRKKMKNCDLLLILQLL